MNTQWCANITGDKCENGQAAFYYSQGCFIGCDECDHMSGRRQTDLCKKGKKATVNDPMQRSVNRNATAGSPEDIYRYPCPPRARRRRRGRAAQFPEASESIATPLSLLCRCDHQA